MGNELYNDPMADELELSENYYLTNFNRILNNEDLTLEMICMVCLKNFPNN